MQYHTSIYRHAGWNAITKISGSLIHSTLQEQAKCSESLYTGKSANTEIKFHWMTSQTPICTILITKNWKNSLSIADEIYREATVWQYKIDFRSMKMKYFRIHRSRLIKFCHKLIVEQMIHGRWEIFLNFCFGVKNEIYTINKYLELNE